MGPPDPPPTAARGGQVGINEISDELVAGQRMVLADTESFIPPLDDEGNQAPVYPSSLLGKALPPSVICLRVVVGADGRVPSSTPLEQPPLCPAQASLDPLMLQAARSAVATWRFEPGLRCLFPDVETKRTTYGSCGESPSRAEPVTLTYRFVFEQRDGKGTVRIGGGE
ncbi:energy transducer TonB [Xanthomonas fragariae]|uniref:energy transducer TonB n=1 Tax=Xanthomonas fragariae TaxID=48664 RepID=UPI001ABE16DC|nr:hypothetical protein [Xanthomonas fragariae]UKR52426.1 hypothetical protein K4A87_18035 [Xanthomonas fragariae]WAT15249.1 hypothetical protein OZ429_01510 [Xanthomonas fragariae]